MTPEQRIERGTRARHLRHDETFKAAIADVDVFYRNEIFTFPDAEKREDIYHEYHALRRVLSKLAAWEQDGEMARDELSRP